MISIDNSTKLNTFTAIGIMARGLERWFPGNNGPFGYGTRLAEETGELVEAAWKLEENTLDTSLRHHVVKELEDVLQIVMGVLGLYGLGTSLSKNLESYSNTKKNNIAAIDAIIQIAVTSGAFANAINHAQDTGIKASKHGQTAPRRLVQAAKALIAACVWIIDHYSLKSELEAQIIKDFQYLRGKQYIVPKDIKLP